MAVDPDLDRIREVGADLNERSTELGVPDIEVEARRAPLGLAEGEPRQILPGTSTVRAGEHPLKLLRHPDRNQLGTAGGRGLVQQRPHHIDLPVTLGELDHRHATSGSITAYIVTEPGADLLKDRRRRDRITQMTGQERNHLTGHLQVGHVPVEIDPVQTLKVQTNMPIKQIVHRHWHLHGQQPARQPTTNASPPPRRSEAEPH